MKYIIILHYLTRNPIIVRDDKGNIKTFETRIGAAHFARFNCEDWTIFQQVEP